MSDTCPSCNIPWSEHSGIAVTCRKLREVEAALDRVRLRCLICGCYTHAKTAIKQDGKCEICKSNQWEAIP